MRSRRRILELLFPFVLALDRESASWPAQTSESTQDADREKRKKASPSVAERRRRRRNQINTDLLYDAVQGLWAADVKTDENCIRVRVGQRPHVVVVGGTC